MIKKIITIMIIFFSSIYSLDYNYLKTMNEQDIETLKIAGIEVKESFKNLNINWYDSEVNLFNYGVKLLEEEHDIYNASRIFSYLTTNYKAEIYLFYLGKCYYMMAEHYYEGYNEKYYRMAYDIFEKLYDKNDKNIEYLRWYSYSSAKLGNFIRDKEKGKLSGLSYLRKSISINSDILDDFNKNDEDALITEAEYQAETDDVPIFGGSLKKAYKIIDKVLSINPNSLRANMVKGKFLYKYAKNYGESIKYLKKAIEIYDNGLVEKNIVNKYIRIFLDMHLVRVYNYIGDSANSFLHLKSHLSMLPRSISGLNALIDHLEKVEKNKSKACIVAKRLASLNPYWSKKDETIKRVCIN
ncbi:MAG TPA: hypothetical protein PKW55_06765 [Spirochaetota bacterium]|nr:hypothetical protein [Spirochaetota bacterium]HOM39089.1 hypothetical protein [Spirochaetota bacterium]HPQ49582.1 hypothetical protein [Spirochaetota bacterium]